MLSCVCVSIIRIHRILSTVAEHASGWILDLGPISRDGLLRSIRSARSFFLAIDWEVTLEMTALFPATTFKDDGAVEDASSTNDGMIWIPDGTFRMGSDRHDPEEAPVHRVTASARGHFSPGPVSRTLGQ